jgi:hypothetical protein
VAYVSRNVGKLQACIPHCDELTTRPRSPTVPDQEIEETQSYAPKAGASSQVREQREKNSASNKGESKHVNPLYATSEKSGIKTKVS